MIELKMFCNIKDDSEIYTKQARCEVFILQGEKAYVFVKDKKGHQTKEWISTNKLINFRYLAWYNGIKEEFHIGKKLAKIGTTIYNHSGQDWNLIGKFEIPEIKKLINQMLPYANYYINRATGRRS